MLDFLFYSFTLLFVVLNPVSTAALFVSLTHDVVAERRRRMAGRACLLSFFILVLFAFGGEGLLSLLGITLPAFRIGGGTLLLLLATDMVFARQNNTREVDTTEENTNDKVPEDISVFPLAFPLISGPGAMTTVILLMGQTKNDPLKAVIVLGVVGVMLILTWAFLLQAQRMVLLVKKTGINIISRLLGILLVALAVQFVLDGIKAFPLAG